MNGMSLSAIVNAMAAAGCSPRQIAAAVEAAESERIARDIEKRESKRSANAERQRRLRERRNADNALHDVIERDDELHRVTSRDSAPAYKDNRARTPGCSNDLPTEDINYTPTPTECPQGGRDEKSKPVRKTARGTRLDPNWTPSETEIQICLKMGYPREFLIGEGLEEFRGYWIPLPGAKATKLDWGQTFCNRMREHPRRRFLTGTADARAGPSLPRKRMSLTERMAFGITSDAEEDEFYRNHENRYGGHDEQQQSPSYDGQTIDIVATPAPDQGNGRPRDAPYQQNRRDQPNETVDLWDP